MSIGGAAVGLIAGGLLTTYLSWRWVLFVNVPIGILVALIAPRALAESERRPGRFDLPGAITSTLGLAALVYGLTSAATSPNGVSHWGDTRVVVSLTAAVVLLATFILIEARSKYALMPLRIFRNRDRSAANLIMLCIGTAMFGMFFFLTIFVQTVWGYSALKTGVAYLPMVAAIMVMAGVSAQLVTRIGARPLLIAGSVIASGGMFWLSRINEHSTYAGGLLGPMLVTAAGLGMLFMPVTLIALNRVPDRDAGLASSLPNVGQQVGGSIGLALLGTVAWTVVANTARSSAASVAAATRAGHPPAGTAAQIKTAIYDHALSVGFSRGFEVSAGIMLIALIVTLAAIRVKRADLAGAQATLNSPAGDVVAREAVEIEYPRHAAGSRKAGGRCPPAFRVPPTCASTSGLEFDHIDPATKCFAICADLTRARSELLAEVAKCQLLCRPCHIAKGAEDRPEVPHGLYRYEYWGVGATSVGPPALSPVPGSDGSTRVDSRRRPPTRILIPRDRE